MHDARKLLDLLASARLPLEDEKRCQAAIAKLMDDAGIDYEREEVVLYGERLTPIGIIDFMVGDVGVEVKVGKVWSQRDVLRQIQRYASCDMVKAIILATNRPMALPAEIGGKHVHVVNIGKGWL